MASQVILLLRQKYTEIDTLRNSQLAIKYEDNDNFVGTPKNSANQETLFSAHCEVQEQRQFALSQNYDRPAQVMCELNFSHDTVIFVLYTLSS